MPKAIYLVLLFFIVQSVSASSIWESDSPPQLYSTEDKGIIPSNVTNFQDILYNKNKVTIFQFYNSWCGHCRRYAPHFKEFGKLTQNWSPIIQTAAINCVDESNEEICRNYSVTSYPTVRLFWTNVNNGEDIGEHVEQLKFEPEFLRDAVIKFVLKNLKTKSAPVEWPNLNKIQLTDHEELKKHLQSTRLQSNVPVAALIEKNDSYIGQQIIFELAEFKDKVEILSFEITPDNQFNFTLNEIANKTTLIQFEPNSSTIFKVLASLPISQLNQTAYYTDFIDQNLFDSKLLKSRKHHLSAIKPELNLQNVSTPTPADNKTSQSKVQPEDLPLTLNELYGAIRYTLYHQIPLKKSINGTQLNILKRFIDIIERYFPFDDSKFVEFIKNLSEFLKSKEQQLDINDYLNHLKKNEYDFDSKFQSWSTCKGSEPKYRGYTCSLWSLFHTLTFGEYLKEKDTQKWVNLHEVLFTMRDYIGNFFSCTDCAQHFTSMAANLENELKHPNSSVLWLWQGHNRVNKRLKGDLTEDPQHPKGVYPYEKNCPKCYLSNGEFNMEEVMQYLIDRYGFTKVKVKALETPPKMIEEVPQSERLEFEADSFRNNNKVFNYTDYSLIFGLYILITSIVMSVFFYLPMRIRRKAKFSKSTTGNSNRYLDV